MGSIPIGVATAMQHVFVVQHEHELADDVDVKLIGVYATREDAERAVERVKQAPGFRDFPDGFFIDEYEIGEDHWIDGFVSPPF